MENPKDQIVQKIKASNAILVTVSSSPSVDQLAACIALTLALTKLNKHGSAIFSGKVPSTIEFLKPEATLEKTTDSLQDFIISLDKNKADKLRYKLEDQMVKIFITPYRTSLNEDDLVFSQGDFNIDLIITLGVQAKDDLDQAIMAHGSILHDATIASIDIAQDTNLGAINWNNNSASSISELAASLISSLGSDLLDQQISTALLTGIVAETNRFSNDKTTPQTMSVASDLMKAGANQQLIASELEVSGSSNSQDSTSDGDSSEPDDVLSIEHDDLDLSNVAQPESTTEEIKLPEPVASNNDNMGTISGDESGVVRDDQLSNDTKIDAPANDQTPEPTQPIEVATTPEEHPEPVELTPPEAPAAPIETTQVDSLPVESPPGDLPPLGDQAVDPLPVAGVQPDGSQIITPDASVSFDEAVPTTESQEDYPEIKLSSSQTFSPPPNSWNPPEPPSGAPSNDQDSDLDMARNSVDSALQAIPPNNDNNMTADTENKTGLDPALFSEPPTEEFNKDSKAPPVPPPVVQLPYNDNQSSNSSD